MFMTGGRSASDTQGFAGGEPPSITLQRPSPRDVVSEDSASMVESSATSGVARMTFSSGSKTQSGFTPDKDHEKRPEPINQEVCSVCCKKSSIGMFMYEKYFRIRIIIKGSSLGP